MALLDFEESYYSTRRWYISLAVGILVPPVGIVLLPAMLAEDLKRGNHY